MPSLRQIVALTIVLFLVSAYSPAQVRRGVGGVGVGVGVVGPLPLGFPGYFGPGFGIFPGGYQGFYDNGFSMYGPPVRTYGPVPGYFGGSDQRNFGVPRAWFDWPTYAHPALGYPGFAVGLVSTPYGATVTPGFGPAWLRPIPEPGIPDVCPVPDADSPAALPASLTQDESPTLPVASGTVAVTAEGAKIIVRVPDPRAEVTVDGLLTARGTMTRVHQTPAIVTGQSSTVTVVARWHGPNGMVQRNKSVQVGAGQIVNVDMATE